MARKAIFVDPISYPTAMQWEGNSSSKHVAFINIHSETSMSTTHATYTLIWQQLSDSNEGLEGYKFETHYGYTVPRRKYCPHVRSWNITEDWPFKEILQTFYILTTAFNKHYMDGHLSGLEHQSRNHLFIPWPCILPMHQSDAQGYIMQEGGQHGWLPHFVLIHGPPY